MTTRQSELMALGLVSLLVYGCPPSPGDPDGPSGAGLRMEMLVDGAAFPTAIDVAADGRIFYTEKETGHIRVVTAEGQLLAQPFATVPVVSNAERGLLGIALHPEFESNGYVYIYYTRSSTNQTTRDSAAAQDNRVVRFTASGNVAAGQETPILILPVRPGPNHNAGHLTFGPDGKLYITIGDLTDSSNAQSADALAGKIHRINDDGSIPADNPFGPNNPAYALGLRNSFDLAFDPFSGVLFATENGTFNHDEVNRIVAGGNYGWPEVQGISAGTGFEPDVGTLVDPLVDYDEGSVVPTGLDVAPDDTFGAAAEGSLLVALYRTGEILQYTLNAARDAVAGQTTFASGFGGGITDIHFGPDGLLYVVTSQQIYRVSPE